MFRSVGREWQKLVNFSPSRPSRIRSAISPFDGPPSHPRCFNKSARGSKLLNALYACDVAGLLGNVLGLPLAPRSGITAPMRLCSPLLEQLPAPTLLNEFSQPIYSLDVRVQFAVVS